MLTYHFKKKIGNTTHSFSIENEDFYSCVAESRNLSFADVPDCGKCHSENLFLNSRKGKDKFEYVFVQCTDCGAFLNFGKKTDNKYCFYLQTEEITNAQGKLVKQLKWQDKYVTEGYGK